MGIGVSIIMIVVGAILTFALNWSDDNINLDTVGWILMIAGAVGLIITLAMFGRARRTTTERSVYDANNPGGRVVEQQRTTDDGPPPMR